MIYLISDLHGYPFERFTELLQRAGFSDDDLLYVLGDVVDRGEDGVRYLLWLKKQKNIELLLGNHELMMRKCDFLFSPDAPELMGNLDKEQKIRLGLWMSNGAKPTLSGLFGISQEEREELFRYLNALPTYREVTVGGRRYLLTHSGLRDFEPQKALEEYSAEDFVWNRTQLDARYFDDITTVFGHSPTFFYGDRYKGDIIVTDTWVDIDVGAGYGIPPVLLRLDDMARFVASSD